ncbi:putative reverse transcriptase domain-containing protein [Tanacetum coccineum]
MKKSVRKIVEKCVAKAIEKYEKTRADSNNTGGSGSTNTGGIVVPEIHGCSYKTFMNCKPHSFKGTEGVSNVKAMMTTEYCPATEIQRMEQELWNLTLKGDDIEAYNNRFHKLALMCHELVPTKKKKIESNVKAMMTTEYCPATEIQRMEQELWNLTLKGDDIEAYNNRFHKLALMCHELPATLHDAINMARELVEQSVQGRATRIRESNKRKWERQPEKQQQQ